MRLRRSLNSVFSGNPRGTPNTHFASHVDSYSYHHPYPYSYADTHARVRSSHSRVPANPYTDA